MSDISISYVIATKNRLPFLKILFSHLLPTINPDEEIVVVDGDSNDGAKEYLLGLLQAGKINQFISEPDKNQAHAWNKALLMAKGAIIKKLIDDDVPDIGAIRRCNEFMVKNPGVDICISDMLDSNLGNPAAIGRPSRLQHFKQWQNGETRAFTFSDVTMLIRRSSLSYLGLYDTQFKMIDWEYSLRVSYLRAGIAYYTGYNALSVTTPGNVSSTASKELFQKEELIGKTKYEYAGDGGDISNWSKIKIMLGTTYHNLAKAKTAAPAVVMPPEEELATIYASYYQTLEQENKIPGEFIYAGKSK
ncbi:MAG: glycosyltransferase [Bacteroidetes bacterium]|nr:glycosyltransferase [Bacteroidota bacterium]